MQDRSCLATGYANPSYHAYNDDDNDDNIYDNVDDGGKDDDGNEDNGNNVSKKCNTTVMTASMVMTVMCEISASQLTSS